MIKEIIYDEDIKLAIKTINLQKKKVFCYQKQSIIDLYFF